jgi:hypothetical protein
MAALPRNYITIGDNFSSAGRLLDPGILMALKDIE